MGQQQILIIVLSLIIVGTAIIAGINIFETSSIQSNKDAAIFNMTQLASLARTHYYRPAELGGGGYSFANFNIPESLSETENGIKIRQTKQDHKPDHIHFEATGEALYSSGNPIKIEARITFDDISIEESTIKLKPAKKKSLKKKKK